MNDNHSNSPPQSTILSCGPFARIGKAGDKSTPSEIRAPIYPSRDYQNSTEAMEELETIQIKIAQAVSAHILPPGSKMEFIEGSKQVGSIVIPCKDWEEAVAKSNKYKNDILDLTGATEQQALVIPKNS